MAIYLDNAATTYPKPEAVYAAMEKYLRQNGASAGRGNYKRALAAEEIIYKTRAALARLFKIKDAARIIFTANVTEALNLALKGYLKSGDKVLTTNMEHNSMWRPLKKLERDQGIIITELNCAEDGTICQQEIDSKIAEDLKLVCCLHASNVLGSLLPLDKITRKAHEYNIPVLVDAAQTAGVYHLDVEQDGIDLLAFTGHKGLLGPMGTGGLYIRPGLELDTFKEGGTGSSSALEYQPQSLPDRYEAGTLNIPGLAGLLAAVEFIEQTGLNAIREKEQQLINRLSEILRSLEQVTVYGPAHDVERVGLISFNIDGVEPEEVAYALDEMQEIMVRAGLHCAPKAHRLLGTETRGAVRVSVSYFNEMEHLKAFEEALKKILYAVC